jgi:hypothetical protein
MEKITRQDISGISSTTLKEFGITLGSIIAIVFGFIPWVIHSSSVSPLVWLLAVFICTMAILKPLSLRLPYFLWMKLGYYVGLVQNMIILTVIFYFILYPTAILMRLFKHTSIPKKPDIKLESYRILSNRNLKNMKKPF